MNNIFFINRFVYSKYYTTFAAANTGVAQLVEHRSPKPGVGSSSLSSRAKKDYSMPRHWIIFFYIFYFLKEFAKVYEFVGSTATLDVAKCKQSLLLY